MIGQGKNFNARDNRHNVVDDWRGLFVSNGLKRKTKKVLFRIEVRVFLLFCTRVRMSPLEPLSSWVTCLVRISFFCLLSGSRFIPKYPVSWKFEEFMSKVYSFRYD